MVRASAVPLRPAVAAIACASAVFASADPGRAQEPRLFYEQDGAGSPVVLVPDWAHDTTVWFRVLPRLREGRRLVRYDLRGQGRSEAPEDGDYSLAAHRRDLWRLLDGLDLGRVHLIGAGVGGTVALAFAAESPGRVRSVVAIDPPLRPAEEDLRWWNRFLAAYDRVGRPSLGNYTSVLVERWFGTEFASRHPWVVSFFDLVLRRQRAIPLVSSLGAWLEADPVVVPEVATPVPVLVVRVGRDPGRAALDPDLRAGFPRLRRTWIESGPVPQVEAPGELTREIELFLKDVEETEGPG
ncbi:MAG: alpha/beta fold hydrolase [Gemmatimonadota bacterium]|nr:alpha/beta fold hydrolase [Gemmatimonadota bacterium]